MKRSHHQPERRYVSGANTRHSVAVEAARLLYSREYKEYFQAKREAARRLSTTVLPTNSEIHQQLLQLADKLEGGDRKRRLLGMRRVALEMMTLLEAHEPRLIGSTWTGHIRQGSDIDLNLYGDSLDSVTDKLETALIPFDVEQVSSRKQGHEREFTHVHVHHPSGLPVEITLYETEGLKVHPTCSITGGPMPRGTLSQLSRLLLDEGEESSPAMPPAELSCRLYPLDLDAVMVDFPELALCQGVQQNHRHHLDVYEHTVEVTRRLEEMVKTDFEEFGTLSDALKGHFASPGPEGWTRPALLVLSGLCHDLGKPSTWSLHRTGRIQFLGHERASEAITRALGQRWELPPSVTERVSRVVAWHMEPVLFASDPGAPSKLYELFHHLGDLLPELMLLSVADMRSARGPAQPEHRADDQMAFAKEMLEEFFDRGFLRFPNTPVSAVDLGIELGIGEGRMRDKLVHHLTLAYVDGEFQGREDGLAYAADLMETSLHDL